MDVSESEGAASAASTQSATERRREVEHAAHPVKSGLLPGLGQRFSDAQLLDVEPIAQPALVFDPVQAPHRPERLPRPPQKSSQRLVRASEPVSRTLGGLSSGVHL
jgi:hypothetical protein